MYPNPNMSSPYPENIPLVWFVSRREHLETYQESLSNIYEKLTKISGVNNLNSLLQAIKLLNHVNEFLSEMTFTLEHQANLAQDEYNPYKVNELKRAQEIASVTSGNLQALVRQVSWGHPFHDQVVNVKRNIFPLIKIIGEILDWLKLL